MFVTLLSKITQKRNLFSVNTYQRPHARTLLKRLREEPGWPILVTGPRHTGKTTMVDQALREIRRPSSLFAVDDPDAPAVQGLPEMVAHARVTRDDVSALPPGQRDARWLVTIWEQARQAASVSDRGFVLAIDEIQNIPDWPETVERLSDADRQRQLPLHVVLLGSAPEDLARSDGVIDVEHWSFAEMAAAFDFDLDRYVYFGGYPGSAQLIGNETRWRDFVRHSLIEPAIELDVLAQQRVDKPDLLKRFFALGTEYSGQIRSYNKMLGQLDEAGNSTTLARYLDLLSNAGLITGFSKYPGRRHRRRASSPRLNVLNNASMSAHSDYTFGEARADRTFWGRLVESAVGAHLVNTCGREGRVYYWRDRGLEVDFILEHGGSLVAFEVNTGVRRGNVSGLGAFGGSFPVRVSHVVGKGGIPVAEFLLTPAREWDSGAAESRRPLVAAPTGEPESTIEPCRAPGVTVEGHDRGSHHRHWREFRDSLRANLDAVRHNLGPPALLHTLAKAYLGGSAEIRAPTARERLLCMLDHQEDLLMAVLDGFKGAIDRPDLPKPAVLARLYAKGRLHLLTYATLAGLREWDTSAAANLLPLHDRQLGIALAMWYTTGEPPRDPVRHNDLAPVPEWLTGATPLSRTVGFWG